MWNCEQDSLYVNFVDEPMRRCLSFDHNICIIKQDGKQDNKQDGGGDYMSGYVPPFQITNEILSYVASIAEKIGKMSAVSNLESKPHLRRNNRIKSIHSSLKIEANSLSLGLKSKETFRKNYMNPALNHNLVKMTIPDKPNSKNQRYIKY